MHQELNCPRCENSFDIYDRTPQMLPKCGHSMCMHCLREQTKIICPEDGIVQPQDLNLYPVNQAILKIINKSSLKNSQIDSTELGDTVRLSKCENFFEIMESTSLCKEHNKKIELVCLEDHNKICVNCALFGGHKHHNVRNIDEVISEIQHSLEETVDLMQQIQSKIKSLKQPIINKKIRDQIRICIKQQQTLAEEQFKEMITQLMMKQRKVVEEIEQKYKQVEDQLIKREQQYVNQVIEKADLWMLASQERINQFASLTEKGEISFFLLQKDTSNTQAKQIIDELEDFMKKFQIRLQEVTQGQIIPQVQLNKELMGNFEYNYPQVQQSFFDDPNILRDVSMIDQSFLKDIDDKPPHNEFLTHNLLNPQPLYQSQSALQSQPSSNNISQNAISPNYEKKSSQNETLISPKLRRQSSMSPKRPAKKKFNTKVESILLNCNGDTLDLSQQDLGDDGMILLEESIRNKKVKIIKLMRNKISDTGACKLLELHCQILHLQSNVITERFLDSIQQLIQKQTQIHIKTIYLGQNLMNLFRVKKKIEDLKKLGITIQI
ncbi:unnamed protein product [Paramecium primaurelia]|uniref:RING-type domain-containing protein n=1 Tax=Paramecium primaurelia TaxID=5886 RepID=A0A8S1PCE5_PARPR|nr:unnamed protein product [Paramecium primaurelia]